MIKINLNGRRSGGGGGGTGPLSMLSGSFTQFDMERLKDFPIKKIALPLFVGLFASYLLDGYKVQELKKIDIAIEKIDSENKKLQAENAKSKDYDLLKKQFDEDEKTIRTKLDTIQSLMSDRAAPSKMMVAISTAIPADVWLTEFKIRKTEVEFKGTSLGYSPISDFMKSLTESANFTDVELKDTKRSEDYKNVETDTFELKAKRR